MDTALGLIGFVVFVVCVIALAASISFNLAAGYTPAALLENNRLSATVLTDI